MALGKRNALGKGLSALLQDNERPLPDVKAQKDHYGQVGRMDEILVGEIEVNPFQPRTNFDDEMIGELADSVKLHGIIQPLTVRRISENAYQLISGERRLRAAKMAGMPRVPVYIRTAGDQQMLEMALIENIQREDLNALEVALSFQRMIEECKMRQEDLGQRVSKSRSTVTNYLRLLKLPVQVQSGIKESRISMGHAKAVMGVTHPDNQLLLYNQIVKNDYSVRKAEELSRELQAEKVPESALPVVRPLKDYSKLQDVLASRFGSRVQIKVNANQTGKLEIPFLSSADFNRILEIIGEKASL